MIYCGDKVVVVKDFYKGFKGIAVDQRLIGGGLFSTPSYQLLIDGKCRGVKLKEWIFYEHIERDLK